MGMMMIQTIKNILNSPNCVWENKKPKIRLDDKGSTRKIMIMNSKRENLLIIRVDNDKRTPCNGVLKSTCCDWSFYRDSKKEFYLCEIKGGDIKHAYEQIITTFDEFKRKKVITNIMKVFAYAAISHFPKVNLQIVEDKCDKRKIKYRTKGTRNFKEENPLPINLK